MTWNVRRLLPELPWRIFGGRNTILLDRGAVQFDYPRSWSVEPGPSSVALLEGKPPRVNRLEVSYLRIPAVDWSGLPVADLVDGVTSKPREHATCGPLREEIRGGIELSWRDVTFASPAISDRWCFRVCVARRGSVHCLITYEFHRANAARCNAAWQGVLETLALDRVTTDRMRWITR